MQSGVKTLSAGGGASLCCLLLLWLIYSHLLREGQLAVGTCEIVMLNRDSSVPRRTIARQTARCACRRGQIAGTTRARPACVDARIVRSRQWCEMAPCLEGEVCSLLFNRSGWTCTRGSGRIKTVTAPLTVHHASNASELPALTEALLYNEPLFDSAVKQNTGSTKPSHLISEG
ncbi:Protein FAM19A5 [Scomber scombrus]|uniref:Protein FAM19A5 n=1 Tax=Scomber scombrus TaxID=13677 RepID=A0AAV1N6R1_SCOSC